MSDKYSQYVMNLILDVLVSLVCKEHVISHLWEDTFTYKPKYDGTFHLRLEEDLDHMLCRLP